MPYTDFDQSAQVLDSKRLNSQLLEGRIILSSILEDKKGWRMHAATRMWEDYPGALINYLRAIKRECETRGFSTEKNGAVIEGLATEFADDLDDVLPYWLQDPELARRVTRTHRASLYRKDPIAYPEFADDNIDYLDDVCCRVKHKVDGKYRGPCKLYWAGHVPQNIEKD